MGAPFGASSVLEPALGFEEETARVEGWVFELGCVTKPDHRLLVGVLALGNTHAPEECMTYRHAFPPEAVHPLVVQPLRCTTAFQQHKLDSLVCRCCSIVYISHNHDGGALVAAGMQVVQGNASVPRHACSQSGVQRQDGQGACKQLVRWKQVYASCSAYFVNRPEMTANCLGFSRTRLWFYPGKLCTD